MYSLTGRKVFIPSSDISFFKTSTIYNYVLLTPWVSTPPGLIYMQIISYSVSCRLPIIVAKPFNFVRSGRVVFQSFTISIQSRRVLGLESVAPVQDKSIRSQLKQKTINYSKGALIGPWSRQHTVYHFMHSEMPIVNNNECYLRLSGHFLKLLVSNRLVKMRLVLRQTLPE